MPSITSRDERTFGLFRVNASVVPVATTNLWKLRSANSTDYAILMQSIVA
jgi:hypothetical protein